MPGTIRFRIQAEGEKQAASVIDQLTRKVKQLGKSLKSSENRTQIMSLMKAFTKLAKQLSPIEEKLKVLATLVNALGDSGIKNSDLKVMREYTKAVRNYVKEIKKTEGIDIEGVKFDKKGYRADLKERTSKIPTKNYQERLDLLNQEQNKLNTILSNLRQRDTYNQQIVDKYGTIEAKGEIIKSIEEKILYVKKKVASAQQKVTNANDKYKNSVEALVGAKSKEEYSLLTTKEKYDKLRAAIKEQEELKDRYLKSKAKEKVIQEGYTKTLSESKKGTDKYNKALTHLKQSKDAVAIINGKVAKTEKKIKTGRKELTKVSDVLGSRNRQLAQDLQRSMFALSGMTFLLVAPMAAAIKKFAATEDLVRNWATIGADTEQQVRKMHKSLLTLAADDNIRQNADELATALYEIDSASMDASERLTLLKISAESASPGIATTKEAALLLTKTLNITGKSAVEAREMMGMWLTTVKYGQTKISELSDTFGKPALMAQHLGIDIENVASAMATLTRKGLDTKRAATGLTRAMQALENPTKHMEHVWGLLSKREGEEFETVSDLIDHYGNLQNVLEAVAKEVNYNDKAMSKLFSRMRGRIAALALVGKNFDDASKDIERFTNTAEVMEDMLSMQREGLAYKLDQLSNKITKLSENFVMGITPAVKAFVSIGGSLVTTVNNIGEALPVMNKFLASLWGISSVGTVLSLGLAGVGYAVLRFGLAIQDVRKSSGRFAEAVTSVTNGIGVLIKKLWNFIKTSRVAQTTIITLAAALAAMEIIKWMTRVQKATLANKTFETQANYSSRAMSRLRQELVDGTLEMDNLKEAIEDVNGPFRRLWQTLGKQEEWDKFYKYGEDISKLMDLLEVKSDDSWIDSMFGTEESLKNKLLQSELFAEAIKEMGYQAKVTKEEVKDLQMGEFSLYGSTTKTKTVSKIETNFEFDKENIRKVIIKMRELQNNILREIKPDEEFKKGDFEFDFGSDFGLSILKNMKSAKANAKAYLRDWELEEMTTMVESEKEKLKIKRRYHSMWLNEAEEKNKDFTKDWIDKRTKLNEIEIKLSEITLKEEIDKIKKEKQLESDSLDFTLRTSKEKLHRRLEIIEEEKEGIKELDEDKREKHLRELQRIIEETEEYEKELKKKEKLFRAAQRNYAKYQRKIDNLKKEAKESDEDLNNEAIRKQYEDSIKKVKIKLDEAKENIKTYSKEVSEKEQTLRYFVGMKKRLEKELAEYEAQSQKEVTEEVKRLNEEKAEIEKQINLIRVNNYKSALKAKKKYIEDSYKLQEKEIDDTSKLLEHQANIIRKSLEDEPLVSSLLDVDQQQLDSLNKQVEDHINLILESFESLSKDPDKFGKELNERIKDFDEFAKTLRQNGYELSEDTYKILSKIKGNASSFWDGLINEAKRNTEKISEVFNVISDSIIDTAFEMFEETDRMTKEQFNRELRNISSQMDDIEREYQNNIKIEEEYQEKLKQIRTFRSDSERYQEELDKLNAWYEEAYMSEQEYQDRVAELREQKRDMEKQYEEEHASFLVKVRNKAWSGIKDLMKKVLKDIAAQLLKDFILSKILGLGKLQQKKGEIMGAWGATSAKAMESAAGLPFPMNIGAWGIMRGIIDTQMTESLGKVQAGQGLFLSAKGGYFDKPSVTMVAEGKHPEYIIPEPSFDAMVQGIIGSAFSSFASGYQSIIRSGDNYKNIVNNTKSSRSNSRVNNKNMSFNGNIVFNVSGEDVKKGDADIFANKVLGEINKMMKQENVNTVEELKIMG